jgi:hypothetical protein
MRERLSLQTTFQTPLHCSGFDPLLVAVIRALIRRLALALRRIVTGEAGSIRGYGCLESQRTRQHVGVATKTPLGVKARGRGKEAILHKAAGKC